MSSRLRSKKKQSNTSWHKTGQMYWWAKVAGQFIDFDVKTRGDKDLDCTVDFEPGTEVQIGVGRGDASRIIRDVVVTE